MKKAIISFVAMVVIPFLGMAAAVPETPASLYDQAETVEEPETSEPVNQPEKVETTESKPNNGKAEESHKTYSDQAETVEEPETLEEMAQPEEVATLEDLGAEEMETVEESETTEGYDWETYEKPIKDSYGFNKGECEGGYIYNEEYFYNDGYDHWNVDKVYDEGIANSYPPYNEHARQFKEGGGINE